MDKCKACEATMIWAISPAGARSPIDYAPSEQGNVLLLSPTGLGEVLAVVLSKDGLELARNRGLQLRTSHFVTCPNREEFKR
jgi:hypothetical protein